MATCDKFFCNHCEEVFDSKNKLHDHIRSHKSQKLLSSKSDTAIKTSLTQLSTPEKNATSDADIAIKKAGIEYSTHATIATSSSATKSIATHISGLIPLFSSETKSSDTDIAIKKREIKYSTHATVTHASAAKSISPHKFSLSALIPAESTIPETLLSTPLPAYRAMSPPPPTYETATPKAYLTIADLYMRYAPLKSIKSTHSRPTTTRTISVLPTMSIQDLYKRFDKEKRVIPTPNKAHDSPTNQNAASDCQKSHFECSDSTVKTTLSITTKSIIQTSTTQPSNHMRPSKHSTRVVICINDVRRHTMSPIDLAVADQDAYTISYIWHPCEERHEYFNKAHAMFR
ncbi:MAG: hypothetical protein ASARMPRED_001598 [Alectoria sarmentosa]|nr:MAG: hypothetical protein ASARMPRED_001598 [Alectoria sarmentosa]